MLSASPSAATRAQCPAMNSRRFAQADSSRSPAAKKAEQPKGAAERVGDLEPQAPDPDREQHQPGAQRQQAAESKREEHQVHQDFAGQAPQRPIDDAADIARSEDNTGQPVVFGVEHRIVQNEQIGLGVPEIVGEREPGHQRADDEGADCQAEEKPGEDPQRALPRNTSGEPVVSKL